MNSFFPQPRVSFCLIFFGDCSFTLSIGREGYLKSIPVDGAHLLVDGSPRLSRTDFACAPWRFFQPGCVGRRPIRVWGGPVEPTTVVKVEAPLNGRVLWKGLPPVSRPRGCSGSPYRINKKG